MAATTITTEAREALRESVDDLVDEIVNGDDSSWKAYADKLAAERTLGLTVFGMFKPWSSNNMFYLAVQSHLRAQSVKGLYAGVDQWRKRGRSLREDQKPFVIFGPPKITRKRRDDDPAAAAPAGTPAVKAVAKPAGKAETVTFWCRPPVLEVYDWTQTVFDDPDEKEPDFTVPLSAGDQGTLDTLVSSCPVGVRLLNLAGTNDRSYLDASGITLDDSAPVANQIFALVGELAHHHLGTLDAVNSTRVDPGAADYSEAKAELVQVGALAQYLAMKMLGLDGDDLTAAVGAHLRAWVRTDKAGVTAEVVGYKSKRKLVMRRFDAAVKAADKIVGGFVTATNDVVLGAPALVAIA